jgi:alkanesulfonate monooxygenase SsuD/methylene tetrahydromethanopterin reductase-like flavin-dependent oxidoreductase (luciferase family)
VDVCVMIEGQEGVTWEQWLSFDRASERGALDAWTALAGLAAVTERIRLGTMVSPATFRHPSVLAKSVATADHISGGRIELGMGAGWFEREHDAFGFPFPPDAERFDVLSEQVEIVHRLWDRSEGEVTFAGDHYRLDAVEALPKPLQEPHPPLILGGGAGPRAAALAARWADEYDVVYVDPDEAGAARGRLAASCEAIGRDPDSLGLSLMTGAVVAADRRELERRVGAVMEREGESGDVGDTIQAWRADRIVGTVDEVLARLAEYAVAGVQRVLMQHLVHDDLEMLELIGAEIVPAAAVL